METRDEPVQLKRKRNVLSDSEDEEQDDGCTDGEVHSFITFTSKINLLTIV